jgi:hypothetical protein
MKEVDVRTELVLVDGCLYFKAWAEGIEYSEEYAASKNEAIALVIDHIELTIKYYEK